MQTEVERGLHDLETRILSKRLLDGSDLKEAFRIFAELIEHLEMRIRSIHADYKCENEAYDVENQALVETPGEELQATDVSSMAH